MFVYIITNKINNKKYVGQHAGNDLQQYFARTIWLAQMGYQGKRLLYRTIRKYGPESFEIKPLVIVTSKWEMDLYEIGMIKALELTNTQKGYNITQGGGGSLGVKFGEETRAKMSKAREGKKMSEKNRQEFIKRIKGNKFALGRKMTKDNFDKLRACSLGVKRSEEARKRMSEAHKGKSWSPLQHQARHIKFHTNRGIINPQCVLCREATNGTTPSKHPRPLENETQC